MLADRTKSGQTIVQILEGARNVIDLQDVETSVTVFLDGHPCANVECVIPGDNGMVAMWLVCAKTNELLNGDTRETYLLATCHGRVEMLFG